MPKVIGVKFKKNPKTYFFAPGEFEYKEGCGVLVETARGLEYGMVTMLPSEVEEKHVVQPLKPVIRLASDEDRALAQRMEARAQDAVKIAAEAVEKSGLDMRLSDAEYTFDGSKLILYFTADNRVDFRDLVRDLASIFKARIELRQIGSRDECKIKGGLGPCGRACCCSAHLADFEHATIKMAKTQGLSLNPQKISGLCGRLMCCLAYENDYYAEVNKRMPKLGAEVETPGGLKGTVAGVHQLKETVNVKIIEKDSWRFETFPLAELKFKGKTAGGCCKEGGCKDGGCSKGAEDLEKEAE